MRTKSGAIRHRTTQHQIRRCITAHKSGAVRGQVCQRANPAPTPPQRATPALVTATCAQIRRRSKSGGPARKSGADTHTAPNSGADNGRAHKSGAVRRRVCRRAKASPTPTQRASPALVMAACAQIRRNSKSGGPAHKSGADTHTAPNSGADNGHVRTNPAQFDVEYAGARKRRRHPHSAQVRRW